MKRKLQITVQAASILALSTLAQDACNPRTNRPNKIRHPMAYLQAEQLNVSAKADDIIGMAFKNFQEEKLHQVEDLAEDAKSQSDAVHHGFFSIGYRLTPVPPPVTITDLHKTESAQKS